MFVKSFLGADCAFCPAIQQLLGEVVALDPRLHLITRSLAADPVSAAAVGIDRVPAIVISRDVGDSRLRYYGIPSGHEFGAFVAALVAASRHDGGLAPQSRRALAGLARDVHLQVFVTPACPYCPGVARLVHAMAIESPRVRAGVIEATEFPELANRYRVYGVPNVIINETMAFEGTLPEAAFVAHVLRAAGVALSPAADAGAAAPGRGADPAAARAS
jgi:glutaredoxin-like protein